MNLEDYNMAELFNALKNKLAKQDWLTLLHAMIYTGKSPATLHRYISNELARSCKNPVGTLLISRVDLDQLM